MNDLDDRLRATLHEVAGTVPPSPHARADLSRRLRRRDRRPMLVAAAAAVVVAATVLSVALTQNDDPASHRVATGPPTTYPGGRTTTKLPNGDLAGPIELGRFDSHGEQLTAMLRVTAMTDGEHWCIDAYGPVQNPYDSGYCDVVPTWPATVPPGQVVITSDVLPEQGLDSGPLPHLMLLVTSPAVTTLEVTSGTGQPVTVRQIAVTPGARFYLADFAGPKDGFGYTAKDAAGNVLVSAIT